ncbi:MAG TPA: purine-nucleoside phosphorylase [Acidimicrobiia bacterium]|jgi:purine-nucleoside phosphorylase
MADFEALQAAAAAISDQTEQERHDVGVVLGSGLGQYPKQVEGAISIAYESIAGFPSCRVEGHSGTAYSAAFGSNLVLLLSGRVHAYEGHPLDRVTFAVRTAVMAGCRTIVLTNAAGACGEDLAPGDLVLIRDHLNLTGRNPLEGDNDPRLGPRFPDMSDVYSLRLRSVAREAADAAGVELKDGVYAWLLGPSYETPAEIRMVQAIGGDMVGMSTVPEAIAARHMGAEVLGISLITNLAAGMSGQPLSHEEVSASGQQAAGRFGQLLSSLLPMV